jgi:two-component system, OmpR family, response regulator RpaA
VTTTKEVKRAYRGGMGSTPEPAIGRDVFTTGQAANRCKVAPRTVAKWCDSGELPCYRIPGGLDRRIHRNDLIAFMRRYDMRLGDLEDTTGRVLLVSCGPATCAAMTDALAGCEVRCSVDGFAAGQKVSQWRPETVVVDLSIGTSNAVSMARAIREAQTDTWTPRLIALGGDDADHIYYETAGYDAVLSQGDDAALVATIRGAV